MCFPLNQPWLPVGNSLQVDTSDISVASAECGSLLMTGVHVCETWCFAQASRKIASASISLFFTGVVPCCTVAEVRVRLPFLYWKGQSSLTSSAVKCILHTRELRNHFLYSCAFRRGWGTWTGYVLYCSSSQEISWKTKSRTPDTHGWASTAKVCIP